MAKHRNMERDPILGVREAYIPPSGYKPHLEHHRNFYNVVRSGPALLTKTSLCKQRACKWDAEEMVSS